MKSIADGGLCHQFHYAGVVTKIISMIDETATRLHVEDRSCLMFASAERRRRVKLFRELQKTADKIRRGPLIDLWRTPPPPRSPNRIQHISLRARIYSRASLSSERPIKQNAPSRPGARPILYVSPAAFPTCLAARARPQLKQRTGEHDVSP